MRYKTVAISLGANIVRRELKLPEVEIPAADPRHTFWAEITRDRDDYSGERASARARSSRSAGAELLARFPESERVDGRGGAVLPASANTHTHFLRTPARGIHQDLSPSAPAEVQSRPARPALSRLPLDGRLR